MGNEGQSFAVVPVHDGPKERTGKDIGQHCHHEDLPDPRHFAGDN
jgi:hypothetical protein